MSRRFTVNGSSTCLVCVVEDDARGMRRPLHAATVGMDLVTASDCSGSDPAEQGTILLHPPPKCRQRYSRKMIEEARELLIGVWRVGSYQDRPSVEDEWDDTYGADVDGLIIYHASGWLSVQVAGSDGRYDAYFGLFTIVEAAAQDAAIVGVVRHEVLASSITELLTADETRPFRVTDATLVLGDGETWRRTSSRVS